MDLEIIDDFNRKWSYGEWRLLKYLLKRVGISVLRFWVVFLFFILIYSVYIMVIFMGI